MKNSSEKSDLDTHEKMKQSIQFGVIPAGLSDCVTCAAKLLRKCRCPGRSGGGDSGGGDDAPNKTDSSDPFSDLKKQAVVEQQSQSSTGARNTEIRLVPETRGHESTAEEKKAADAILLKMKALFDQFINELEERGVPKHQLRNYYFHIDNRSHSAVVNIPNDDHHDEFLKRLREMKLLPNGQQKMLDEEDAHHARPFNIKPLSTKLEKK